jgi:hypothetical protein
MQIYKKLIIWIVVICIVLFGASTLVSKLLPLNRTGYEISEYYMDCARIETSMMLNPLEKVFVFILPGGITVVERLDDYTFRTIAHGILGVKYAEFKVTCGPQDGMRYTGYGGATRL